jgi:hypothetical protein
MSRVHKQARVRLHPNSFLFTSTLSSSWHYEFSNAPEFFSMSLSSAPRIVIARRLVMAESQGDYEVTMLTSLVVPSSYFDVNPYAASSNSKMFSDSALPKQSENIDLFYCSI